ncbi:MAG TPA: tetratricopeptide repeat protein [Candidatus Tectomicrobia bacterium]|nr:tetratricopeptide repeat protein [Candidatus Tectomicrobia bacterium]
MRASDQRARNRAKLTRKDLKAPDEFITVTGRFLRFAGEHLRTIALMLGGVVTCVVVVWGLLAYVRGIERGAFASLWHIEAQLRSASDGDAVPPASAEHLQQIARQFGAGEARGYAWLYLGHVRYRQGDYAAAVTAYQQAVAQGQPISLLWSLASLGTAYALEASGDFKQAQDAYQRVIEANPVGFVVEAYLGKGRVAEQSHDVDTTIAAYAAIIDQFPARAGALGLADKLEALRARR